VGSATDYPDRFTGAPEEQTMPKMKTNRAAAKRFKITATGRVRRSKSGASHFMAGKPAARLRRLRQQDMVDPTMERRVKQMLPYGTK
jgi:large subunit ribosomal protein L35